MANSRLHAKAIEKVCALDTAQRQLLELAMHRLGLSARAAHRILKVARTIADLEATPDISNEHLSEAIQYRCLDRRPPTGQ